MTHLAQRRHALFGVLFPFVVALFFVVVALFVSQGAPPDDGLALPWLMPSSHGSLSLPAYLAVLLGATVPVSSLCGWAAGTSALPRWIRRALMAAAVGFSLMGAVVGLSGLLGQMKEPAQGGEPDRTAELGPAHQMDMASLAAGAGLVVGLAVVVFCVYQPPATWGRRDERFRAEAVAEAAGAPTFGYWVHPRSSLLLLLALLVLPCSLLALVHPLLALAGVLIVLGSVLWLLVHVRVDGGQAEKPQLRVWRAGALPVVRLPVSDCLDVTVLSQPATGSGNRCYGVYRYPAVAVKAAHGRVLLLGVPADCDAATVARYLSFRATHPQGR